MNIFVVVLFFRIFCCIVVVIIPQFPFIFLCLIAIAVALIIIHEKGEIKPQNINPACIELSAIFFSGLKIMRWAYNALQYGFVLPQHTDILFKWELVRNKSQTFWSNDVLKVTVIVHLKTKLRYPAFGNFELGLVKYN